MFTEIYLFVNSFFLKLQRDRIYNYAASSAFFIILSIFPFLILLITLVQYTPLTQEFIISLIDGMIPNPMYSMVVEILEEIFNTTAGAGIVFASAAGAIWSASKGIVALIRGLNSCFNVEDKRNYFHVRLLSCLYTIVMIIVLAFSLVLMVFGSTLYNAVQFYVAPIYTFLSFILKHRVIISVTIMTLLFTIMYVFLPAKNNKFVYMLPGAFLAALAWMGLSELISIYVDIVPSFSYTYGSLTSFILLMLWLYIGMYIVFVAAEINLFFKLWIEKLALKRRRKKALKYEAKQEAKQIKADTKRLKREQIENELRKHPKK